MCVDGCACGSKRRVMVGEGMWSYVREGREEERERGKEILCMYGSGGDARSILKLIAQ